MKPKYLLLYAIAILLVMALFVYLNAPYDKETYRKKAIQRKKDAYEKTYVDYSEYLEGRVCPEVRFGCLPESRDKSWQEQSLSDGLDSLEITAEAEERYKRAIASSDRAYRAYIKKHPNATRREIMLISSLDKDFIQKVEAKRFMIDMEQQLAKEFPGFWRDTPKAVRYRWIRRAMNKAKVFGYDPEKNNGMVELCARIGLDFDKDPKWKYIAKFVSKDRFNIGTACNYIDWTIFNKTVGYSGIKITDWSMQYRYGHLPPPKKPYPRLNEGMEPYYR